jgi:hypothetical protein
VHELLTRPGNRIDALLSSGKGPAEITDEIFWTALSRAPSPRELERGTAHLQATSDRRQACEDLLWALLNSKEFIFRR